MYDVGAIVGVHTLTAARAGAWVTAFEPLSRLADRPEENLRHNRLTRRVVVERTAVGETTGTATLLVAH